MSDMTYPRLGNSGCAVSRVGLGTNNFGFRIDPGASREVLDAALDAGITLIDTSDSYGDAEVVLGDALVGRRDEVVLATKFGSQLHRDDVGPDWGARGSRRYIRAAVERSLRRLRTDWIDLYQLHRPDPRTPVAETLGALEELVDEGKVRYLGCSNFAGWQVADAAWTSRSTGRQGFVSVQNHWNLLERGIEDEVVPAAAHFGMGILPYFPLASGVLTGKYRRGEDPPADSRLVAWGREDSLTGDVFAVTEALEAFARTRGITLLDVAMGWLASRPGVASVIAGATRPEQVTANVAAAAWEPTDDDLVEIDRITRGD
jgi:aryl-alcohol dehydrogenase-like predicted oxidoreductase